MSYVNALSYGLGAVLSHVSDDGEEKTVMYASCSLSASEENLLFYDLETSSGSCVWP